MLSKLIKILFSIKYDIFASKESDSSDDLPSVLGEISGNLPSVVGSTG